MSAQDSGARRVVEVRRDGYELRMDGTLLPETTIDMSGDWKYALKVSSGANIGITREYGDWSGWGKILDIADHDRDFTLPGDEAEPGSINFNATYDWASDTRRVADGVDINHLHVEEEYRGEGIGLALFDMFRTAAVWVGGYASGKVGGGEGTAAFYRSVGIPDEDIDMKRGTWSPGDAPAFKTDAMNLVDGATTVRGPKPE